jgi:hypothetical protein
VNSVAVTLCLLREYDWKRGVVTSAAPVESADGRVYRERGVPSVRESVSRR